MKQADMNAIESVLDTQSELLSVVVYIGVLSPSPEEIEMFKKLYPNAVITSLWQSHWDIDAGPWMRQKFDLLIAANVFMASQNVAKWLENALASCKVFLLQDSIRAWRGSDKELGDGDYARFCFPLNGHIARIDNAFDMTQYERQIIHQVFYTDDPGYRKHDNREMDAKKFVALIKPKDELKKKPGKALTKSHDVVLVHGDPQGADVSEHVSEKANEARVDGGSPDRELS